MSTSHRSTHPFIEERDALVLAEIINRASESFDARSLSSEEAQVLYVLFDIARAAVWNAHEPPLAHLVLRAALDWDHPDDDNDNYGGEDGLEYSPDGTHIVSASYDKTARVWNADGSGQPLILSGHESGVLSGAFGGHGPLPRTGIAL